MNVKTSHPRATCPCNTGLDVSYCTCGGIIPGTSRPADAAAGEPSGVDAHAALMGALDQIHTEQAKLERVLRNPVPVTVTSADGDRPAAAREPLPPGAWGLWSESERLILDEAHQTRAFPLECPLCGSRVAPHAGEASCSQGHRVPSFAEVYGIAAATWRHHMREQVPEVPAWGGQIVQAFTLGTRSAILPVAEPEASMRARRIVASPAAKITRLTTEHHPFAGVAGEHVVHLVATIGSVAAEGLEEEVGDAGGCGDRLIAEAARLVTGERDPLKVVEALDRLVRPKLPAMREPDRLGPWTLLRTGCWGRHHNQRWAGPGPGATVGLCGSWDVRSRTPGRTGPRGRISVGTKPLAEVVLEAMQVADRAARTEGWDLDPAPLPTLDEITRALDTKENMTR